MANNIGSFWTPHYTKTMYSEFYEHPPLIFIFQSFFFKVLGDGIYTERIYSFFMSIFTSLGILLCWQIFHEKSKITDGWFPIFLWITIPQIFWSYRNNLLENTLSVLTIFSVYFITKALLKRKIIYLIISAVLIMLSFFSKGLVGIFPVIIPIIYTFLYMRDEMFHGFRYNMWLLFFTLFFILLILVSIPELHNNLFQYFERQVIPALQNKREITTNYRLAIIADLALELSFPILLFIISLGVKFKKSNNFERLISLEFIYFLIIGLSASLPLIISLKQRKFYLVPAIPFYILAISFVVFPVIKPYIYAISSKAKNILIGVSTTLGIIVLIYSIVHIGSYSRDKEKLTDIYLISQTIPAGTIISTTDKLWKDWGLVAYLSRVGYLSLDSVGDHQYYLDEKNNPKKNLNKDYFKMDLKLYRYVLLKKGIN